MMKERYHETTQNRVYPDTSNVNKNIAVEAKLISPPTYNLDAQELSVELAATENKRQTFTLQLQLTSVPARKPDT